MNLNNGQDEDYTSWPGVLGGRSVVFPWTRQAPPGESILGRRVARRQTRDVRKELLDRLRLLDRPRRVLEPMAIEVEKTDQIRLSGPAQVIERLSNRWHLSNREVSVLLGLESPEMATDVLRGASVLRGRDAEDRMANLFSIFETLFGLLNDAEAEREWLRQPREAFRRQACLDVMLKGGLEDLINVRRWLEHIAGR